MLFGVVIVAFVLFGFALAYDTAPLTVNWKAEGEWIVFYCGIFTDSESRSNLYIVRPDGSELQQITNNRIVAKSPSWSPDGTWIVFHDGTHVYRIRPNGKDITTIVDLPTLQEIVDVVWSPNGQWIAYNTIGLLSGQELWLIQPDGTNKTRIAQSEDMSFLRLSWSNNSQQIAFANIKSGTATGVYSVDIQTHAIIQTLPHIGAIQHLEWLPNNDEMLVEALPNRALYRLNLDTLQLTPIELDSFYSSPSLSPDGTQISYSGIDETTNQSAQILVTDFVEGTTRSITDIEDCLPTHPRWYIFSR